MEHVFSGVRYDFGYSYLDFKHISFGIGTHDTNLISHELGIAHGERVNGLDGKPSSLSTSCCMPAPVVGGPPCRPFGTPPTVRAADSEELQVI